jgi:hypothetical protein
MQATTAQVALNGLMFSDKWIFTSDADLTVQDTSTALHLHSSSRYHAVLQNGELIGLMSERQFNSLKAMLSVGKA